MQLTVFCYGILIIFLIIATLSYDKIFDRKQIIIIGLIFIIGLILCTGLRTAGADPDYDNYKATYISNYSEREGIEFSVLFINNLGNKLGFSYIFLFIVYALLSIPIKYFAIKKYATYPIYSLCVWLSFSFILHDMIQIRVSVAAGILLWMIPAYQSKKYIRFILLWILAIMFHKSAIILGIIILLRRDTINKLFWIVLYTIGVLANLKILNYFDFINYLWNFMPEGINNRTSDLNNNLYRLSDLSHMTMYARYILIPTIIAFISLFSYDKICKNCKFAAILIKLQFIGILIYSFQLPILSVRLYELFSVSLIYLLPLLINIFNNKYRTIFGSITVSIFCLSMAWNLLSKQEVFTTI